MPRSRPMLTGCFSNQNKSEREKLESNINKHPQILFTKYVFVNISYVWNLRSNAKSSTTLLKINRQIQSVTIIQWSTETWNYHDECRRLNMCLIISRNLTNKIKSSKLWKFKEQKFYSPSTRVRKTKKEKYYLNLRNILQQIQMLSYLYRVLLNRSKLESAYAFYWWQFNLLALDS